MSVSIDETFPETEGDLRREMVREARRVLRANPHTNGMTGWDILYRRRRRAAIAALRLCGESDIPTR